MHNFQKKFSILVQGFKILQMSESKGIIFQNKTPASSEHIIASIDK
jgi:hypothetical protein